jgi:hypothetical protein
MKELSKWLGLVVISISAGILVFLKVKYVFSSGNQAGFLALLSIFTCLGAIVLGLVALPRWQAYVILILAALVAYFLFFTPLYAVP